jgi:hypothetical protein
MHIIGYNRSWIASELMMRIKKRPFAYFGGGDGEGVNCRHTWYFKPT